VQCPFGPSVVFNSWNIDPLVESDQEIWEEIAKALEKGKVETAAAALAIILNTFRGFWPIRSGPVRSSGPTMLTSWVIC
jgi:hypothetical protein